jgi:transcriptional regulator with XRE-family HTH domain
MEINVGEKIKKAREEKNYTQDFMAAQLGKQQPAYSRLEKRGNEITVGELIAIANILSKPISYFLPETASLQNGQLHFLQQVDNFTNHYHYQMTDEQLKTLSQFLSNGSNSESQP